MDINTQQDEKKEALAYFRNLAAKLSMLAGLVATIGSFIGDLYIHSFSYPTMIIVGLVHTLVLGAFGMSRKTRWYGIVSVLFILLGVWLLIVYYRTSPLGR